MAQEAIKNDDIIQLKQMIIFLKAELIKYETMDSVSEMNRLKEENRQLMREKEALQKEVKNSTESAREPSPQLVAVDEKLAHLLEIVQDNKTAQHNMEQLSLKIAEKESMIAEYEKEMEKLNKEVTRLAQENEKMRGEFQKVSPELIRQMDFQMKEVIRKSMEYTKQVDEKLDVIEQMERKVIKMMDSTIEEN